jgi:hypothetical protein
MLVHPSREPVLIGLDLLLIALVGVARRRKILAYTQTRYNKSKD